MVFSSISFLFFFLPILIIFYFIIPKRYIAARKYTLMSFSLLFYVWGEPLYIFAILACIYVTWLLSDRIAQKQRGPFILALAINIIPLIIFKYLDFIITNLNFLPLIELPLSDLIMPIGISFYTFQMLTYIIDLYLGKIKLQRNLGYLTLYIFLFPQLIAGPIVRYSDVENELGVCNESLDSFKEGMGRFIKGLSKKVLIANQVAVISDTITACELSQINAQMTWLAVFAYTMQIYFDFSGYSDMAIGLGKMFGFKFPENFKHPYSSLSVSEFWRRWHITMGSFFREYVYFPLGGSRCSQKRTLLNLMIVWTLTGLWHGASWNFVIWGMYFAALLIMEKLFLGKFLNKIPRIFSWAYTFLSVMIGWSFFMRDSNSITEMFAFTSRLFDFSKTDAPVTVNMLNLQSNIPFLVLAAILALPTRKIFTKIAAIFSKQRENKLTTVFFNCSCDLAYVSALILCVIQIVGDSYNPFIYFRF